MCSLFTPLLLIYRAMASSLWAAYFSLNALHLYYVLRVPFAGVSMMSRYVLRNPICHWYGTANWRHVFGCCVSCRLLDCVRIVLMAWREFLSDDLIPKLCRLCILVNTQVDDYSLAFLLYSSSLYSLSMAGTVISYIITFTVNVNSTAEDRCVTKLCMLVSVVYMVCWTPFLLVQLLEIFGSYTKVYFNLYACASATGVFASAINPGIYTTMDAHYGAKFCSLLFSETKTG